LTVIPWKRTVLALLLFGIAFGYLEAAVVTYLRALHEPARQRVDPGRSPAELFPLLTLEQLHAAGPEQQRTLFTEIGREAATIIMLAAIALAIARNAGEWAAAFVITFGAWDLTFYIFLKVRIGWPASLYTLDILFLIPVPWVGPVLAPLLVSAAMIGAGVRPEAGPVAHVRPILSQEQRQQTGNTSKHIPSTGWWLSLRRRPGRIHDRGWHGSMEGPGNGKVQSGRRRKLSWSHSFCDRDRKIGESCRHGRRVRAQHRRQRQRDVEVVGMEVNFAF
jgi:hypothetical protein